MRAPPSDPAARRRAAEQAAGATVSVIVPCFNYGHLLEGCVASVLAQRGVEVEVLVIDDCSGDSTAAIGERLAAADGRVEFRRHARNAGLIATANEGLAWARGQYVMLLSADDLLVVGALARAAAVMVTNRAVGLVYGKPLLAHEGRPLPEPSGRWRTTKVWRGEDWIRLRCRSGYNCISSPEALVRTSVQRAVGGYDPGCPYSSDLNNWLRIAAVADVAHVRGIPQAIYRVHASSMSRSQVGGIGDLRARHDAFAAFFATSGSLLGDRLGLERTAARTLAAQALWKASRLIDRGGERGEVEELMAFALETYPGARGLREWKGLQMREWIGSRTALGLPLFTATGAAHRLRGHLGTMRLRNTGV